MDARRVRLLNSSLSSSSSSSASSSASSSTSSSASSSSGPCSSSVRGKKPKGPILYWMFRDQRCEENWAMQYAQQLANLDGISVGVVCVFVLIPNFRKFALRHYDFMLRGMDVTRSQLQQKNIPLLFKEVDSATEHQVSGAISALARRLNSAGVVVDFDPLRDHSSWCRQIATTLEGQIEVHQVDAHNVVPCWCASPKLEYAARTIRPKINKQVDYWLNQEFTQVKKQAEHFMTIADDASNELEDKEHSGSKRKRASSSSSPSVNSSSSSSPSSSAASNRGSYANQFAHFVHFPEDIEKFMQASKAVTTADQEPHVLSSASSFPPGPENALTSLKSFCTVTRIGRQGSHRNDPNHNSVLSGLSPYITFGQLSCQRIVKEALEFKKNSATSIAKDVDTFVEEVLIRRELSDNFCFYNPSYDSIQGAYSWAQDSLKKHEADERPKIYSFEELETAQTGDELWNAAQLQLREEGKMHGFLRMYWAKKILEWTKSPEEALEFALHLNDKWSIDGNCPNGVVGVMWSICGIHDQGWKEREVFGKIRYMNYAGCRRKFDVDSFVAKYVPASGSTGPGKKSSGSTGPGKKSSGSTGPGKNSSGSRGGNSRSISDYFTKSTTDKP